MKTEDFKFLFASGGLLLSRATKVTKKALIWHANFSKRCSVFHIIILNTKLTRIGSFAYLSIIIFRLTWTACKWNCMRFILMKNFSALFEPFFDFLVYKSPPTPSLSRGEQVVGISPLIKGVPEGRGICLQQSEKWKFKHKPKLFL